MLRGDVATCKKFSPRMYDASAAQVFLMRQFTHQLPYVPDIGWKAVSTPAHHSRIVNSNLPSMQVAAKSRKSLIFSDISDESDGET